LAVRISGRGKKLRIRLRFFFGSSIKTSSYNDGRAAFV
jgi:hypothetical protein